MIHLPKFSERKFRRVDALLVEHLLKSTNARFVSSDTDHLVVQFNSVEAVEFTSRPRQHWKKIGLRKEKTFLGFVFP